MHSLRLPRQLRCGRPGRSGPSSSSRDHGPDSGLGDQAAGDLRLATEPPHVLFTRDFPDVVLDRIAWDNQPAELGPINGEEVDVPWLIAAHLRQHADRTGG